MSKTFDQLADRLAQLRKEAGQTARPTPTVAPLYFTPEAARLPVTHNASRPSAPRAPKPKRTYAAAQVEILRELENLGWTVRRRNPSGGPMKVPHATSPEKKNRLDFHAQAIHRANGAGSLWLGDYRNDDPAGLARSLDRQYR
jgi:hypothetical protein